MEFIPTDPDKISWEAIKYLSSALDDTKINDVLNEARRNEGTIITIQKDKVIGAFYIQIVQGVMNVLYLGCENVKEIKEEFPEYIKKTMRECGVENLALVSRGGLHKVFKDLNFEGCLYTYRGGM